MTDFNNAQDQLKDLMFTALDHGIDSVKDSGGSLISFLMTDTNGEKKLQRFVTERIEDGPPQARKYLSELDNEPEFAVIAFDGYVTMDKTRFDAVMVEGYGKNDNDTYVLAQRYKPKKFLSKFAVIGNAAFLGSVEKETENEKGKFFSFIMFQNDDLQLEIAEQKLRDAGLKVEKINNELKASWDNGPELIVSYSSGEKVQQDSERLGNGSEYENELKSCQSRFEISFDDIDDVLDEMNTLIEVQGTLQDISDGISFNSWNQQLSKE